MKKEHHMNRPLINTRRRLLLGQTAVGASLVMGGPLARAALGNRSTVDVTEGPYFVDELLNRSDIRVDPTDGSTQAGLLLLLSVSVSTLDTTTGVTKPLPGAHVDLWHCNAMGLYSDVSANGTVGKKFLRGYQVSNSQGKVQFRSIYPGWYSGRSPHIHCKVRQFASGVQTSALTTQFFFDEQLTQLIYTDSNLAYHTHGLPDQPHVTDQVYTGTNSCIPGAVAGDSLKLSLVRTASYVSAKFDILIDASNRCSSTETRSGAGAGPGGPGGPGGTPPSLPPGVTPATS
jgi:protocatechuate 3,4-dioxygenase beta subunit